MNTWQKILLWLLVGCVLYATHEVIAINSRIDNLRRKLDTATYRLNALEDSMNKNQANIEILEVKTRHLTQYYYEN
jgi:hypothetical protein